MKKLKLSLQNIEGVEVLTREQLKKITGAQYSGCGVKVNGVWHPSGVGAGSTKAFLGNTVNGYDPNPFPSPTPSGTVPGSTGVYVNGSYSGVVTNWCCDSCWWNKTGYA